MVVTLLITILGGLIWWFSAGKIETAGFVFFSVGVFYLVGQLSGYKIPFKGFTTNAGG